MSGLFLQQHFLNRVVQQIIEKIHIVRCISGCQKSFDQLRMIDFRILLRIDIMQILNEFLIVRQLIKPEQYQFFQLAAGLARIAA